MNTGLKTKGIYLKRSVMLAVAVFQPSLDSEKLE